MMLMCSDVQLADTKINTNKLNNFIFPWDLPVVYVNCNIVFNIVAQITAISIFK